MPSEVPDKLVVKKGEKPRRKKADPLSPFKVYASNDTCVPLGFVRISHFDDWDQEYVVEGRARSACGRARNRWQPVARFTRSGSWTVQPDFRCDWLSGLEGAIHGEAMRYIRRATDWILSGKDLGELHRAMAVENGTLPKADMPLSQEEVKYD